jgi:hypothetical protein
MLACVSSLVAQPESTTESTPEPEAEQQEAAPYVPEFGEPEQPEPDVSPEPAASPGFFRMVSAPHAKRGCAKTGYVYLVRCPKRVYAKFGRWTGTLDALRARYTTYYGSPDIISVWCGDVQAMEQRLKAAYRAEDKDGAHRELVKCTPRAVDIFFEATGVEKVGV